MQDILTKILASKREEVERRKRLLSTEQLKERIGDRPKTIRSMRASLQASPSGIIAEFKRRSPSKGWIHPDACPETVVPAYACGGAAAISVLTDTPWFGGTDDDLRRARELTSLPLLRKDFIVDPYQLYEAREMDADVVLLIAAALSPEQCADLARQARALGLETLLEIHMEAELAYIGTDIDLIGVNNRNLGTFHTDIANSFRLAALLPSDKTLVSESGLHRPEQLRELRAAGFRGFLMGEHFMRTPDPEKELSEFIHQTVRP